MKISVNSQIISESFIFKAFQLKRSGKSPGEKRRLFKAFHIFILIAVTCGLLCGDKAFAGDTKTFSSIASIKGLSQKNEFYTIDDNVQVDGNFYRFSLTAPHGEYGVVSIKDLFKVCYEIRVIEEFRATDEGEEAWNGAGESLKNIGRGAKQIVKNPKESAKAFARAGGKLFRGVGNFFKKKVGGKEDAKAEDGSDRAEGAKGFKGKQARKFAGELGLDVYSDNPYVKALINDVAAKRAKGSIGTSIGLFFLAPVAGLGLLGNSLTPDGFNAEAEALINGEAPAELNYVITEKYKNKLRVKHKEGSPLAKFLANGNYTPREQAYNYYHFERMVKPAEGKGVKGLKDAIVHCGGVKSPQAATEAATQVELLDAYQLHANDLKEFVVAGDKLGAIRADKKQFFIVPYDFADDTDDNTQLLADVAKSEKKNKCAGTEIWFTGDVTKDFVKKAKANGVKVKDNALLLPHFAPKEKAKEKTK